MRNKDTNQTLQTAPENSKLHADPRASGRLDHSYFRAGIVLRTLQWAFGESITRCAVEHAGRGYTVTVHTTERESPVVARVTPESCRIEGLQGTAAMNIRLHIDIALDGYHLQPLTEGQELAIQQAPLARQIAADSQNIPRSELRLRRGVK